MTAEVVILNKSAVALAADSAMSIRSAGGADKIYPANKLFTLSKHFPVGIMIYNRADHMGIPYETIIKMFRQERSGKEESETLEGYAEEFRAFLLDERFCSPEQLAFEVYRVFIALFEQIVTRIKSIVGQPIQFVPRRELARTVNEQVANVKARLVAMDNSDIDNVVNYNDIFNKNADAFESAIKVFSRNKIPVTVANKAILKACAKLAIIKNFQSGQHTGLLISGFGKSEIFPKAIKMEIEAVIDGNLKFREAPVKIDIGRAGDTQNATILPLAQSEMVWRFAKGVDPGFQDYNNRYVADLLEQYGKEMLEQHVDITDPKVKRKKMKEVKDQAVQMSSEFADKTEKFLSDRYINPLMDIVGHLPTSELAQMAEALINLTSVKRRVSSEKESVGGPIDVAVITKGDGFVWIKRKHYFSTDLNPHFVSKYFV